MSLISSISSLASGGLSTVYKYAAIAGLALALAVGGFFYGHHVASTADALKAAQVQAKYQAEETDLLGLNTITSTKIVTQEMTKVVTIHDVNKQLQTQITDLHDSTLLSDGWLRIHDSAALGVPSTASESDGATSTTTADQALSTVTSNYSTCNQNAAELSALQAWITAEQQNIATADKVK